jgi:purine-nucleoside phosphorylase
MVDDIALDAAIILGSGLAGCFDAGALEPIGSIEGTSVAGHCGELALWRVGERAHLVALGRRHVYEGVAPEELVRTVAIAARHGARHLIVTNAAGGLSPRLRVGDIMLMTGLNAILLAHRMPLLRFGGPPRRSKDVGGPFERERLDAVADEALARGMRLRQGTYAAVLGPSYETRAEIGMLRRMGADAVGMSTAPEYAAAARLGLTVTGLSLITNTLSDTARLRLDHAEVVDAGARAARMMRIAIDAAVAAAVGYKGNLQ